MVGKERMILQQMGYMFFKGMYFISIFRRFPEEKQTGGELQDKLLVCPEYWNMIRYT